MRFILRIQFGIGLAILLLFPFASFAAELRLNTDRVDVRVGEEFIVEAVLFAEGAVNAVEGEITFPEDMLVAKEVRDGNSSVNFWIENPHLESPGKIIFSGITPGGVRGVNNLLFSIVFEAKKTGAAAISVQYAKALQNDGKGTKISLALSDTAVEITMGDSNPRQEAMKDVAPPEPFVLSVARDASIFEGNWFIVFTASDKGSGVFRYEIKEYRSGQFSFLIPWRNVTNPHVLSDQALKSYVMVRAIDGAGNARVSEIDPVNTLAWNEYGLHWLIFTGMLCTIAYTAFKLWRRYK